MNRTTNAPRFRFLETAVVTGVPQDVAVQTSDGEPVGNLAGFLLVPDSTQGEYAVIRPTGAGQYRVVPLGRTDLDSDGRTLRIDMSSRVLDALPWSDPDRLALSSDDDYEQFRSGTTQALGGSHERDSSEPDWWKATVQARERAQPGAIIGIETAGRRTHLGETKADEKERRDEGLEAAGQ